MDTVKLLSNTSVQMIAHRGLSGLERENTCPAFIAAGMRSYWGIETDVHVTRDGKYIIHHDDSVLRLTGQDLLIRETDFAQLRALRMLDIDGVTPRGDLFLPTLDEYLSICKKYGKIAVLELKECLAERDACGIADAVAAKGMLARTVFISFCGQNLLYVRKKYPQAAAQLLLSELSESSIEFMLEHKLDADVAHRAVTAELVQRMHAEGRAVNAWTVDKPEDAARLIACGVDMITTDILE